MSTLMPDPWARSSAALTIAAQAMPAYLLRQRWYPAKDAGAPAVSIEAIVPLNDRVGAALTVWQVRPPGRAPLRMAVPLAVLDEPGLPDDTAIIAQLDGKTVVDATALDSTVRALVALMRGTGSTPGLAAYHTAALSGTEFAGSGDWSIQRSRVEQSNTSLRVGNDAIFKLLRKLEHGLHPELEMSRFLTAAHFDATPALLGWIDAGDSTVVLLQAFVRNEGDGWSWILARLRENAAAAGLDWIGRLGERTGELHMALAADDADPAFVPEQVVAADWQRWQHAVAAMGERVGSDLDAASATLHPAVLADASEYRALTAGFAALLQRLSPMHTDLKKTRHHGDYHLGQVLVHAGDASIVDFEGEPLRPLPERRAKHCPLRDVAGMLRSFGYAAAVAAREREAVQAEVYEAWVDAASSAFLDGYFRKAADGPGCPRERAQALRLIQFFTIEKALYEVLYELANRPAWVSIPLHGVVRMLRTASPPTP